MNGATAGFLSFNKKPPQLHVCGEDDEFDPAMLRFFRDERFDVTLHSLASGRAAFVSSISSVADSLELGEYYAIVAFGAAATVCLQLAQKPMPRLSAMVVYYPDNLPSPNFKYPTQLPLVMHLAGAQTVGGATMKTYYYRGTEPGFAEMDLAEYEPVAAGLAWSRTLGTVRKGLNLNVDLESVWEEHLQHKYQNRDAAKTMATMIPQPYVNHVPTATGGIGRGDLMRFYRDFFLPNIPPSMKIRLISRTAGVDRVVDEMVVSFRHTHEMPWILPDVPPTNKPVEVAMVSVVNIRGGKLVHEKVYWDQASVLVQIGLLDPNIVPKHMKQKGLEQLPIIDDNAKKVLDEEAIPSNELLDKW
ncbi:putative dienelactone hydrolase [Diplodia seriata]|uniref:Putative dienelactone hydrolase n=1 Tax=Diplodia seriata TaxID=420778 RepID=A0A0G2EWQ6_9PEZI|nr:putative dienelactone hydrolase [Diplodia seriata]